MMNNRKMGTSSAVERIKFVLLLCGQWPVGIASKFVCILYNSYSLIVFIAFVCLYDLLMCASLLFIEDVQDATENLHTSLTFLTTFGKALNYRFFFGRVQGLLRIGETFQLDNDWESQFINRQMERFNKLVTFLYGSANAAVLFSCIAPVFSDEARLPYPSWYPFDWKSNSSTYAWLYIYQVIGVMIQSNLNISFDLLTAYFMHVASNQLQILSVRLHKLNKKKEVGRPNQRKNTKDLVQCISTYQRIWK